MTSYFYNLWRVRKGQTEAEEIRQEAEHLLDEIEKKHSMQAQVGFYPAYGTTDSIILPGAVKGKDLELPTPRQKFPAEKGEPRVSLCDFVAPRGYLHKQSTLTLLCSWQELRQFPIGHHFLMLVGNCHIDSASHKINR